MPQLSPLLWFNLLIMFLVSVMLFFSMTYFIELSTKIDIKPRPTYSQQKNWKW